MTKLFVKYFEGAASTEEQNEILTYIKASPENFNEFNASKETWKQTNKGAISISAWNRFFSTKLNLRRFTSKHLIAVLSAACVVLLVSISSLMVSHQLNNHPLSIKTAAGQLTQIYLPDSTLVFVNSLSDISYHTELAGLRRIVKLSGEAYFQVSEKKLSPFDVYANNVKVHVTGTKFNVKAYRTENIVIALEEGSVDASHSTRPNDVKCMKPNDVLVYDVENHKFISRGVDVKDVLSWTHGELCFNNSRIRSLLNALERKYDIGFKTVSDPRILDMSITLTLEDESLERVLDFISFALPIEFSSKDGKFQLDLDTLRYENIRDQH